MQPSQSPYMYPSSPTPSSSFYDSGYSSFGYTTSTPTSSSFHFSSCPYSNDSFYMPVQPCKFIIKFKNNIHTISISDPSYYSPTSYPMHEYSQPLISSTPVQSSNVCPIPTIKVRIIFYI